MKRSTIMSFLRHIVREMTYSKYSQAIFLSSSNHIKNYVRNVHGSSILNVKTFTENENRYAYNIMKAQGHALKSEDSSKDVSLSKEQFNELLQENLSRCNSQYLFEVFPKLGVYCTHNGLCISNKIFDEYIDCLTDNIRKASDEELKTLFFSLKKFPETESFKSRNFIEVWAALDDECLHRMKNWSIEEMLGFMTLFYMLNITKMSEYSLKCVQKFASKAKQLTSNQIVRTLFFIGVHRKAPIDMHNLELQVKNKFSEFLLDDLAIMSMGFFKSKTPIRSQEILFDIIDKIKENAKEVHEITLAALLKTIRYSLKKNIDVKLYELLGVLQYEVPRLSVMCNVHIALLATTALTFHKDCLIAIANKVIDSIKDARIKDLERIVLTFGTFSFIPNTKKDFFDTIVNELRRKTREEEITKHGRSFACCVSYLGLLGIYPEDLMDKVLSPTFLDETYGKQPYGYGREILTVHNTLEIFCEKSKINRLSHKAAKVIAKRYTDYMPDENFVKQYNFTEKMILDVTQILKECRGSNAVIGDHILTHHQRGDIILCNSPNGTPLPVTETWNKADFGLIRKILDNINLWVVLVIAGRNSMILNLNKPTGPFAAKIRELKALGFHAELVFWNEYNNLKTKEDKMNYLNNLIARAVSKR